MQWGCAHRWKTTTTRPGDKDVVRMRYLTCRSCGHKVKTEERLAVPWSEGDLIAQVKALLPEGNPVYLRECGITEIPLEALNTRLAGQGYRIHASQSGNVQRGVACIDRDGRVTRYALFELRPVLPKPSRSTKNER
jgi:hypothetical protein